MKKKQNSDEFNGVNTSRRDNSLNSSNLNESFQNTRTVEPRYLQTSVPKKPKTLVQPTELNSFKPVIKPTTVSVPKRKDVVLETVPPKKQKKDDTVDLNLSYIPKMSESQEIPSIKSNPDQRLELMMIENRLLQIMFISENLDRMFEQMQRQAYSQLYGTTKLKIDKSNRKIRHNAEKDMSRLYEMYEKVIIEQVPIYERLLNDLITFQESYLDVSNRLETYHNQIETNFTPTEKDHQLILHSLLQKESQICTIHEKYKDFFVMVKIDGLTFRFLKYQSRLERS
jgi:hypothetical protein